MQKLSLEEIQEYIDKQIGLKLAQYLWAYPPYPQPKGFKPILGGAKDKTPIAPKVLKEAREWVDELWSNL